MYVKCLIQMELLVLGEHLLLSAISCILSSLTEAADTG